MRKINKMSFLTGCRAQEDDNEGNWGCRLKRWVAERGKRIRSKELKSSVSVTVQGQGRSQHPDLRSYTQ